MNQHAPITDDLKSKGIEVHGDFAPGYETILTGEALEFVADLHRRFDGARQRLLAARQTRQASLDDGEDLDFRADTAEIREADWTVRPAPEDLQDRRVEITGPVDRKMVINALNSGARCFMADFEDASSPTWANMVEGQINLRDANARQIDFTDETNGKSYSLNDRIATLIVRPRGWHLPEAHLKVDGAPVSGGLFDFGLYLFHNHQALKANGTGPYYYLPKLESMEEARLWALVIGHAEKALGLETGTVRVTVLIETITAAFELDEILYVLRDWIVGLNCGRWDYIFSYIKRFKARADKVLPDRAMVTMTAPFMRAYSLRVIEVCHRRGAHAMGGMSAFIPVKDDEAANARAFEQVKADKEREAEDGHDGTWVAHPALVAAAEEAFDARMPGPNQLDRLNGYETSAAELTRPAPGAVTEDGARGNIDVAIRYLSAWLSGRGAAPIHNLMEDAATAEISRAQLWQWRVHKVRLEDGRVIDTPLLEDWFASVLSDLREELGEETYASARIEEAAAIFKDLVFSDTFEEFLTLPAYPRLN